MLLRRRISGMLAQARYREGRPLLEARLLEPLHERRLVLTVKPVHHVAGQGDREAVCSAQVGQRHAELLHEVGEQGDGHRDIALQRATPIAPGGDGLPGPWVHDAAAAAEGQAQDLLVRPHLDEPVEDGHARRLQGCQHGRADNARWVGAVEPDVDVQAAAPRRLDHQRRRIPERRQHHAQPGPHARVVAVLVVDVHDDEVRRARQHPPRAVPGQPAQVAKEVEVRERLGAAGIRMPAGQPRLAIPPVELGEGRQRRGAVPGDKLTGERPRPGAPEIGGDAANAHDDVFPVQSRGDGGRPVLSEGLGRQLPARAADLAAVEVARVLVGLEVDFGDPLGGNRHAWGYLGLSRHARPAGGRQGLDVRDREQADLERFPAVRRARSLPRRSRARTPSAEIPRIRPASCGVRYWSVLSMVTFLRARWGCGKWVGGHGPRTRH